MFVNEKIFEEYSYEHYKKNQKNKTTTTTTTTTKTSWWKWQGIYVVQNWYLFLWISLSYRNDEKKHADRDLLRGKDKRHYIKNLVVKLLELIQVKKVIQIMKLVGYKHILVSFKTEN